MKKILCCATTLSGMLMLQWAAAQADVYQSGHGGLPEIIVTAQRREESLQNAAIAVTAVTGSDLDRSGITEISSFGKPVPALVVQPTGGATSFFLRGVGTNSQNSFSENAIAFNFNGIYIGRPTASAGVFYDLERVEVVKGPQCTLYGRNATGGTINVLPKKPILGQFGVEGLAEYGNYDSKKGFLAVNLPIGESAALRVAGQIVDRNGYISYGYDDDKGEAARAFLLLKPSDLWSVTVVGDYYHEGGKGAGAVLLPSRAFTVPPISDRVSISDPRAIAAISGDASTLFAPPFCAGGFIASGCVENAGIDGYLDNHFYGVSAQVDGDMGFATLTVIPAWRKSKADFRTYLPGCRGEISDNAEQMSLEARLTSTKDQRLRYVLGAFFFNEQQGTLNYFRQGCRRSTCGSVIWWIGSPNIVTRPDSLMRKIQRCVACSQAIHRSRRPWRKALALRATPMSLR